MEILWVTMEKEDLLILAKKFPDYALTLEMGIGDMSLIRFYEKYKKEVPAIGRIMIWSKDKHLMYYSEDMTLKRRRDL